MRQPEAPKGQEFPPPRTIGWAFAWLPFSANGLQLVRVKLPFEYTEDDGYIIGQRQEEVERLPNRGKLGTGDTLYLIDS